MKSKYIFVGVLFVLTSCLHRPETVHRADMIEQLLQSLQAQELFNGSLMVAEKGQMVLAQSYGHADLTDRQSFTINTTVDGASVAKTFTAAAIDLLQAQGKLSIQDVVDFYVPALNLPDITIEHLLSHTSGLPEDGYFFSKLPKNQLITNNDFLKILQQAERQSFNSVGQFTYSNVGYILLAVIIEQVSGQSYANYLKSNFFEPLKMDTAGLRPARLSDWSNQTAVGYQLKNGVKESNSSADWEAFNGCCNILLSNLDLHQWNASFFQNKASVTQNHAVNSFMNNTKKLNHLSWYNTDNSKHFSGDWRGFYSMAYRNEAKQRSITFVNNNTMPNWLKPQLVHSINQILDLGIIETPEKPTAPAITDRNLLIGTYRIKKLGSMTLMPDADGLVMQINSHSNYQIHLTDDGTWYVPAMDYWLRFTEINEVIHISVFNINGFFSGYQSASVK